MTLTSDENDVSRDCYEVAIMAVVAVVAVRGDIEGLRARQ